MVHKKRNMLDKMNRSINEEREKRYKILEPYYKRVLELNKRKAPPNEYGKLYKEIKENPKFGLSDVADRNMLAISRLDYDETVGGKLYNDPLQKEAAELLDEICGIITEPSFENKIVPPSDYIIGKTYVEAREEQK